MVGFGRPQTTGEHGSRSSTIKLRAQLEMSPLLHQIQTLFMSEAAKVFSVRIFQLVTESTNQPMPAKRGVILGLAMHNRSGGLQSTQTTRTKFLSRHWAILMDRTRSAASSVRPTAGRHSRRFFTKMSTPAGWT